ncbi:MAG: hypothetical protein GJ676_11610 [Rhodobacteraceae bacterium]|nr:hypothetical protein [Paracoccaceae bacterium]
MLRLTQSRATGLFSLALIALLAFAQTAMAQAPRTVATYGAPPGFQNHLARHDVDRQLFSLPSENFLAQDADLVIIFARNGADSDFVPAALYRAFLSSVNAADTYLYRIPKSVFQPEFDADVIFVLVEPTRDRIRRYSEEDKPGITTDLLACYTAAVIARTLSKPDKARSDTEIITSCHNPKGSETPDLHD